MEKVAGSSPVSPTILRKPLIIRGFFVGPVLEVAKLITVLETKNPARQTGAGRSRLVAVTSVSEDGEHSAGHHADGNPLLGERLHVELRILKGRGPNRALGHEGARPVLGVVNRLPWGMHQCQRQWGGRKGYYQGLLYIHPTGKSGKNPISKFFTLRCLGFFRK
jgi:hypothetical protein